MAALLGAGLVGNPCAAQVAPATLLEIEVHSIVSYTADVFDGSKFAIDPNRTTVAAVKNFGFVIAVGDISTVNGRPAKGTMVAHQRLIALSPAAAPGQAIADIARTALSEYLFEIQQADGTLVGNIHTLGLSGGAAPPGAPAGTGNNLTIAGGSGAFLGMRGQMVARGVPGAVPFRTASITEDPERRRNHAAGEKVLFIAQLIPMVRPEIALAGGRPAILHSDFSPVTDARPARPGDLLIARAIGLTPTRSAALSGEPFPANPLQQLSSPVEVFVGGRAAEVLNKVGWPGSIDAYRVDFRVPEGTPVGAVAVQLSSAWILGPEVQIPVQQPAR
jgi:uncharacterized protein (TIGR03437 family)